MKSYTITECKSPKIGGGMISKRTSKTFCKNFRHLMWEQRLSQSEMGKVLDLTQANVSDMATGRAAPSVKTLSMISSHFNVSLDWFLMDRGEMYLNEAA